MDLFDAVEGRPGGSIFHRPGLGDCVADLPAAMAWHERRWGHTQHILPFSSLSLTVFQRASELIPIKLLFRGWIVLLMVKRSSVFAGWWVALRFYGVHGGSLCHYCNVFSLNFTW